MKKLFSILLSSLLCAAIIVFSSISQCYADNDDLSDTEPPIATPCVDEGNDDDF